MEKIETVTRSLYFLAVDTIRSMILLLFFNILYLILSSGDSFLRNRSFLWSNNGRWNLLVRWNIVFSCYIETKYLAEDFFKKKKRKRSLQDCGSKRMKHNSVAKLPRLVAPNSPLARLLFYVKWYNKKERKKKKEKAISLIPRIFQLPNHSYLYFCLPLYPFSFVYPVATNRIIYRHTRAQIYVRTYISTIKMYSWLLETIRRFVFYSNNMPLMNTSYVEKVGQSRAIRFPIWTKGFQVKGDLSCTPISR